MALPLPQHTTTLENLPDEVLSDIFSRLLAKQLARMRCVCKSWNALLSESSFIKSHLHRSIRNNSGILLFFQRDFSLKCSSFTARPSHSPNLELTNFIKLPVNPQPKFTSGRVVGSVNGLICFYYISKYALFRDYVDVYIWNPSLSVILTLPPCSLPCDNLTGNHFRFGYEPKTDDYKVVKLTSLFRQPKIFPQVEVYSMRKGSWELISQELTSHITRISDQDEVCVDGHDGCLYWLGYIDEEMKAQTIVAFDLGPETFHEIPLPGSVHEYVVLGVLGGKLCVMQSMVRDGKCEVWVMDEYGVPQSWVKHHAFPRFRGNICPYGFTSRNELLFKVGFVDNRFALYDPVAAKAKSFRLLRNSSGISKIVKYVDSLVWVAPTEHKLSKGHLLISILNCHQLLKGLQIAIKSISRFLCREGISC